MDELFLKNLLKPLARIQPNSEYLSRSKERIILARQEPARVPLKRRFGARIFEGFTFSAAIALASLLLVVTVGSVSYFTGPQTGQIASSFNNETLELEAKEADFALQIKEVRYFDESAKQVALALDKISKDSDDNEPLQP